MPNQLNRDLQSIQYQKTIAKQKLEKEPDADIRVKLAQRIARLNSREKEILTKLNLRLDDITLTDEKPSKEETGEQ